MLASRISTCASVLALAVPLACGACGGGARDTGAPRASTAAPAASPARTRTVTSFRDLVMTADDCLRPARASVSRADAREDVAVVERIVRRGWAGFDTMSAQGADFDAAFADLARFIAGSPEPIAVEALQDRLVSALWAAADNHLAFFHFSAKGHARRKTVGRHEQAYTADLVVFPTHTVVPALAPKRARLVECEGHGTAKQLAPTIVAGDVLAVGSRPIVLAETPPPPLHCTFALEDGSLRALELPMRRVRVAGGGSRAKPVPAFELREGPVPVVSVHTFWTGKDGELSAFVASGAKLRDSKAIVVDVRGNGGGSDGYAKDWLAQLTSQRLVGAVVDRLDSDVTRQGIVNDNTCQIAEGLDDAAALRDANERLAYGNRVVAEAEAARAPLRVWKTRTVVTDGRAPSPFRAPLVTLVDNGCASACESFVSHARQLERSIVVGENSSGTGAFGEVLVYRLPKSGLGMSAGMKHFHDPEPRRVPAEGRGHLPDYWLDADDPASLAERIADCLAKPACPLR